MPKFMVQVVLHESPAPAHYDKLNAAMVKRGFVRELTGKRASYHLPVGSYWYEGKTTVNDLRLVASAAAESASSDFGIAVVRANGWSIMGLKRVHPASRDQA